MIPFLIVPVWFVYVWIGFRIKEFDGDDMAFIWFSIPLLAIVLAALI